MKKNPLIGTWRLEKMVHRSPKGAIVHPYGTKPIGLLVYTADGHMSVALMASGRKRFRALHPNAASSKEKETAIDSYLSYAGRYVLSEKSVIHHIEVSLYPNWTGRSQLRYVNLKGRTLILTTPPFWNKNRQKMQAIVTWKRV